MEVYASAEPKGKGVFARKASASLNLLASPLRDGSPAVFGSPQGSVPLPLCCRRLRQD